LETSFASQVSVSGILQGRQTSLQTAVHLSGHPCRLLAISTAHVLLEIDSETGSAQQQPCQGGSVGVVPACLEVPRPSTIDELWCLG